MNVCWVFGRAGWRVSHLTPVIIIGNGGPLPEDFCKVMDPSWPIACADGGTNHLRAVIERGGGRLSGSPFAPRLVVGDLDSVSEDTMQALQESADRTELVPAGDQNECDLQKTLREVDRRWPSGQVVVFGAMSLSVQHTLGNFSVMHQWLHRYPVLHSPDSQVLLLEPGTTHTLENCPVGASFGLFPLASACRSVWSSGFQWDLPGCDLEFGTFVSSSNRFANAQAYVSASDPLLLAVDLPN